VRELLPEATARIAETRDEAMSVNRWPWVDYLNEEEINDLRATEAHLRWARLQADAAQTRRTRLVNLGTQRAKAAAGKTDV
jgi:hypothetical protein